MKSIAKNYSINLIYQIVLIIFPVILMPYISRVLGPESNGVYSFTYSTSLYFSMFAQMGISLYGARKIAIASDNPVKMSETFWDLFLAKLFTSICTIILYVLFTIFLVKNNTELYFLHLILFISIALDISWFYIGNESFFPLLIRNIFVKTISLILVFAFVKSSNDLNLYALLIFMSELIGQILMWINIKKNNIVYEKQKFRFKRIITHLKGMIILFIPQLLIQVYTILNITMLGILSNKAEVAYFDYASRIINIALTLVTSLGIVMLPRISKLSNEKNMSEIKSFLSQSIKMMSIIVLPIIVLMIVLGDTFINLYLGSEYLTVGVLLTYFPIKLLLVIYSNVIGMQYLIPSGKNKQFTFSVLSGAIISIVINLLIIKSLGSRGAVISVLVAEAIVTITQYILTKRELFIFEAVKSTWKMFLSSIIMLIFILLIKNHIAEFFSSLFLPNINATIYINVATLLLLSTLGLSLYLIILLLLKEKTLYSIRKFKKNI